LDSKVSVDRGSFGGWDVPLLQNRKLSDFIRTSSFAVRIPNFVLDPWTIVCKIPASSDVYQLYGRLNFENTADLRTHCSFNSRHRPPSHPPQPNQIDRFAPLLRIQRTNGPIGINTSNNVARSTLGIWGITKALPRWLDFC